MGITLLIHMTGKRGTNVQEVPQPGDVTQVHTYPSLGRWGTRERKVEWLNAGNDEKDWPGTYGLIFVDDVDFEKGLAAELGSSKYALDDDGEEVMEYRQRWCVDLQSSALTALATDGEVTLSGAELEPLLTNKVYGDMALSNATSEHPKFVTNRGPEE